MEKVERFSTRLRVPGFRDCFAFTDFRYVIGLKSSIILKRGMILIELTPKSLPIRFIHWRDSKPVPLPKSLMFFRSTATIQSANDWKISQSTSNSVLQIQITSYILVTFSTIAKFWGIHNVTSKREHLNDLYFWLMWLKICFLTWRRQSLIGLVLRTIADS